MAMMVPPQLNPKFKTSLCKHWTTTGNCSIGARCHFAHGEKELRGPNDPLPQMQQQNLQDPKLLQIYFSGSLGLHNYKTTLCKYQKQGNCKYNEYCHFAHSEDELKPYEEIKPIMLQVLVQQYHTLMCQHHLLQNFGGPSIQLTQEQVEHILQMQFQKVIVAQQLKFMLQHLDKMDYTQHDAKLKLKTAHELLAANNSPGCSQAISELVTRSSIPAAEKQHYEKIMYEASLQGQKIVEAYLLQIQEFQNEQALSMQDTYQKSDNPQSLFGNAPTQPAFRM